jgi:predicted transposase/invertase (TIGR01784 family)
MTYGIVIVSNERLNKDPDIVQTFLYQNQKTGRPLRRGKTRIITVELCKAEQLLSKPTNGLEEQEAWVLFFQYLTDLEKRAKINEIINREAGIYMAVEELVTISQDERERARLEGELKYILDEQSRRVNARRMIRKSRRKGRAEGLEKGLERGLEKGLEKGREEEKHLIAKNLKAAGLSLDIIAQSTGLTQEEILEL